MKRSLVVAGVLVLLAGSFALAGDYHKNTTLFCAQCHVMHYSQSHGYNANGSGFFVPIRTGPHEYLLRQEINDLCLYCHDNNGFAPDVLDVNTGGSPADIRLGGYLNRLGGPGLDATGHTLDNDDPAPGSNPSWKPSDENGAGRGLNCINCHHQHGSTSGAPSGSPTTAYRNLRSRPGPAPVGYVVSYNDLTPGVNDLTKDVFQRQARNYDEAQVDFNEPSTTQSGYGKFCGGCHTNFHGTPGDPNTVGGVASGSNWVEFLRHPTAGVNIGAVGGGHSSLTQYTNRVNKVKVMSASGVWNPPATDVTPSCFSCHKAHGNGNAFGLLYRRGSTGDTKTENGDTGGTQLEHLCGQCHRQAAAFSP